MAYATLAELQTWMSADADSAITFSEQEEDLLGLLLEAATTYIEQYTGRTFAAEAAATKEFYADDPSRLALPDIRSITSLTYDSRGDGSFATTLVAGTDYYLTPLNPQPDPGIYTGIAIYPRSSKGFAGGYRVRVVGDWGYVTSQLAGDPPAPTLLPPQNIALACLLQAARYWARKGAPLGMLQNTDLGTFARLSKADPEVTSLLDPYKAATQSPAWLMV